MPKLPVIRPVQAISALEKAGFIRARQKGSHVQMKKGSLLVTVPMHSGDLDRTTLRSILRQANLTEEEFMNNL